MLTARVEVLERLLQRIIQQKPFPRDSWQTKRCGQACFLLPRGVSRILVPRHGYALGFRS
jgi:hypothetical protein